MAVAFAIAVDNDFTGPWPRPWIIFELVIGLTAVVGIIFGFTAIVNLHPAARSGDPIGWPRYYVLLPAFGLCLLGILLLPLGWKQSHLLASLWGLGGVACGAIAYLVGRPWPAWARINS